MQHSTQFSSITNLNTISQNPDIFHLPDRSVITYKLRHSKYISASVATSVDMSLATKHGYPHLKDPTERTAVPVNLITPSAFPRFLGPFDVFDYKTRISDLTRLANRYY